MKLRYVILVVSFLALVFMQLDADAQCAMCKATAESTQDAEDGNTFGNGINLGIMYIMFIPYILLATFFGIFFRGKITGFLKQLGVFSK